jgi:hypothetical protein
VAFRRKCEADRGGDLTWHDGIGCSLDDRVSESLSLVFLCVYVSERERERGVVLIVLFVGFVVFVRSL